MLRHILKSWNNLYIFIGKEMGLSKRKGTEKRKTRLRKGVSFPKEKLSL